MSQRGSVAIHHVYRVRLFHRGNEHTHTNTPAIYVVYNVAAGVHVQYNTCMYIYYIYYCIYLYCTIDLQRKMYRMSHIRISSYTQRIVNDDSTVLHSWLQYVRRCCTKPPKLIGVYGYITCICLTRNVCKLYEFTKCK